MPTYGTATYRNPADLSLAGQALLGETFPRMVATGSLTPAAGDQRATLAGLRAGDVVTNLWATVTVAGASLTVAKLAIWNTTGTLLANTADLSSTFNSGLGNKGGALTAPYTIPADGGYYLGMVWVSGTAPTLLKGTSGITGYTAAAVGTGAPPSVANTGKSDIGTLTVTASGSAIWFGWS